MIKQKNLRQKMLPSPFLAGFRAYGPPRLQTPVDLSLDANEGLAPPIGLWADPETVGVDLLRRYPDTSLLEQQIAERLGANPGQVLATAGADDAIERTIRAFLVPGRELILPVPTFEMLERYAALTGCRVIKTQWMNGPFPTETVLRAVTERTSLIVVVSPNSPTGTVITAAELKRLSEGAGVVPILLDLAYVEFADEDLTRPALELPNVVLTRSMSKAWGLAGLRVGWAAGPREIIGWLRAAGHPYAVSGPSIRIASRWLETGEQTMAAYTSEVRQERGRLVSLLGELGVEAFPSQANFVLGRFKDAAWVRDGLAGMGIAVRIFPDQRELEGCLRITLPGVEASYARLEEALRIVLAPEALLFDIDDTLADVTESYRKATIATADAFGAKVTYEEITEAKAGGNANNDWELTWHLIREQGVEVSLEEVTRKFESIYQGTPEHPGLRASETLLIDRAALEQLAGRFKLGVVTGRPMKDALVFLGHQKIENLFRTVVAMEDAPLKPDPAPIRIALERLGVRRAWMLGDTPDDMRAARAAGVLPLAVLAPSDSPEVAEPALLAAGAGRMLGALSGLEELVR